MSDHEAELRRQATAAGVYLDLGDVGRLGEPGPYESGPAELDPITGMYTTGPTTPAASPDLSQPIAKDEAEQISIWLAAWHISRRQWEAERPYQLAVHRDAWLETERAAQLSPNPAEAQEAWRKRADDWLAHPVHKHPPLPMLSRDHHYEEATGDPPLWQPRVRPLLDPPAGFELVRHSWCPRCDRDGGDPLGRRTIGYWVTYFGDNRPEQRKPVRIRPYCEIVPAPPELEIGQGCGQGCGYLPPSCTACRYVIGDAVTIARWCDWPRDRGRVTWDEGDDRAPPSWCPLLPCGARRLFRWGLRRARKAQPLAALTFTEVGLPGEALLR